MSVEDRELDRDDVVSFGRVCLEGKKTGGYEFVLQDGGVHDDQYFDFFMGTPGEGEMGGLAHKTVEWLVGLALLKMVESIGVMVNVHLYNTWSLVYLESILYIRMSVRGIPTICPFK